MLPSTPQSPQPGNEKDEQLQLGNSMPGPFRQAIEARRTAPQQACPPCPRRDCADGKPRHPRPADEQKNPGNREPEQVGLTRFFEQPANGPARRNRPAHQEQACRQSQPHTCRPRPPTLPQRNLPACGKAQHVHHSAQCAAVGFRQIAEHDLAFHRSQQPRSSFDAAPTRAGIASLPLHTGSTGARPHAVSRLIRTTAS
jgi:hypothetical protein